MTSPRVRRVAIALTAGGAGLALWSAGIHLDLWHLGYRNIRDIGPLFFVQGLAGFVVAAAVIIWRRPLTAMAGAAYLAATAGGLILSATVGVFNFHDGFDAPFARLSLVVQAAGTVVFLLAAVLFRLSPSP